MSGTGFLPGGSELQCTVGGLHVPAHFLSLTKVLCDAPIGQPSWVRSGATVKVCVLYGRARNDCGAKITYYDPEEPPSVMSVTPKLLPLGATSTAVTVTGGNFAPTGDSLICLFGEKTVAATFISGDKILCDAPRVPEPSTDALKVSIDGGETYSDESLVFSHYDASVPPTLSTVWPPVAGLPSRTLIKLTGANFAPTAGFSCKFGSLPAVAATFTTSGTAKCRAPLSPTVRTVGVVLSLDGTRWSTASVPFTFYDSSKPPAVRNISRSFGDLSGNDGAPLDVVGTNLAPTGDGELSCRFMPMADTGAAHPSAPAVVTPASFVSISMIRCVAPKMPVPCTAAVAASTDGESFGNTYAEYTYYDPKDEPHVSSVSPVAGMFQQPTTVTIYGSNFAPLPKLSARWDHLGITHARFVNASVVLATTIIPPKRSSSLSVPVELSFTEHFDSPPPSDATYGGGRLFTFYNPFLPPEIRRISPSKHECNDGGKMLVDVRSGKLIEVSSSATVEVYGENFAPLARLSCVYRRTGESIFDTFDTALPAVFSSSHSVTCPIPKVTFADDGLTLSSKMFFSVSNDGETYRYTSHTFTFHGGCEANQFTASMYYLITFLLFLLLAAICVALTVWYCAQSAARTLIATVMQSVGMQSPFSKATHGSGVLEINVKGATNLPSSSSSSGSTPPSTYVRLTAGKRRAESAIARRTHSPNWDETLTLQYASLSEALVESNLPKLSVRHTASATMDEELGVLVIDAAKLDMLEAGQPVDCVDTPLLTDPPSRATLSFELVWRATGGGTSPTESGSIMRQIMNRFSPQGVTGGGWMRLEEEDEEAGVSSPRSLSPRGSPRLAGADVARRRRDVGTLEVRVKSASSLLDVSDGTSDPYVIVQPHGEKPLRTKVIKKSLDPVWDETFRFHGSLDDYLNGPFVLKVNDSDDMGSDDPLGQLTIDLTPLITRDLIIREEVPLEGVSKGSLSFEVVWVGQVAPPVPTGDGTNKVLEWCLDGCQSIGERLRQRGSLAVTVHSASDLSTAKVTSSGLCDAYVMIKVFGRTAWRTRVQPKTRNPIWDETLTVEGILGDLIASPLLIKVKDEDTGRVDDVLGGITLPLDAMRTSDLLHRMSLELEGSTGGGTILLTVRWTPNLTPKLAPKVTVPPVGMSAATPRQVKAGLAVGHAIGLCRSRAS